MATSRRLWIPRLNTSAFIAGTALFALVTLVLLVSLPLRLSTDALEAETKGHLQESVAITSESVAIQLANTQSAVETFAGHAAFARPVDPTFPLAKVSAADSAVRHELRDLERASALIKYAYFMDATGTTLATEPESPANLGRNYGHRDYFQAAVASDRAQVGASFVASTPGNPVLLPISKAVRAPARPGEEQGRLLGVLVGVVDVNERFQTLVDDFFQSYGTELHVYDRNGILLASADRRHADPATSAGVETALRSGSKTGGRTVDGMDFVSNYVPVAGTGLALSASVPVDHVMGPVGDLRNRIVAVALVLGTILLMGMAALAITLKGRSRAERSLHTVESFTQTVLQTAAQPFASLSADMRVTEWNRRAEKLFGWSRDDVLGRRIEEVVALAGDEAANKPLREFAAGDGDERSLHTEVVCVTRSGAEVTVELTGWTTGTGSDRSSHFFFADITERRRLEEDRELVVQRQRRLVEELRQADKVKSDFISTVSHELRTPLTSIVGYLEMLTDGYGGELSSRQSSMLDVVERNSRRLLSLIQDLLTLSSIESGAFEMDVDDIDLCGLVRNIEASLLPSISDRGLELVTDVDADTATVPGDSAQVERVLLNLLTNAIKFTPAGGRVSLATRRHDEFVRIAVSDTGIGIPLEEQDRLFNRFFRSSTAQEQAIQGTGLGLTIVKSIVERHGGSIEIESSPGRGTTVTVSLPLAPTPALAR